MHRRIPLLVSAVVFMAACGGGESVESVVPVDVTDAAQEAAEDAEDVAEDMAEDMADDLEDLQESQGGGNATLVVGGEEWTFDSVLCAFGEEQIGQEGAVMNLSAIKDGLQLYVSIDSFGHSVTLNDIENFEDPSVSLTAEGSMAALTGGEEEFIVVDGKDVSASTLFLDGITDSMEGIEGTLEATCP